MTKSSNATTNEEKERPASNFIRDIIDEDLKTGKRTYVRTRFPPEPNGYLHIGHAQAICTSYIIAQDYGGEYNLRWDDSDPAKEEAKYVKSQEEDIIWLGFDKFKKFFASDYFDQLYEWAIHLIKEDKAYVDDLTSEEIKEHRGTLVTPGKNSPYRNRSIEENLDLFTRMKNGEFPDGARILRAKIDMAHPNPLMRDPPIYRIKKIPHYRTGDKWCIYPLYDFTHGQSDAIEDITHSLCSIEFENHRPLYNWFIDNLPVKHKPQQIEFAKTITSHTVLSKRRLLQLVNEEYVNGWDDPRMPTLAGMRRRGYPPKAIRDFVKHVSVTKRNRIIDVSIFESFIRNELNEHAPRRMAVLNPLKVVVTNYPENQEEMMKAPNHPTNPEMGTRKIPFSRELLIEKEDFMEEPPKKFFRLSPGKEVRLARGYWIKCNEVVKNEKTGEIIELSCIYDPETKGGQAPQDGRKVKATLHWLSAKHALKAEARLYDRLVTKTDPMDAEEGKDFKDYINPNSLKTVNCLVEPSLENAKVSELFQFERLGYFNVDLDSKSDHLIFNRTIALRDTWAKIQSKGARKR
ncbi:MAG: glutamine--tRNA ligase/YqeY domain fusion protein [Candidatus Hodarchaeales archaeon]|jgi:glutaminyl-tRNA synthetase